jgi:phosphoheptose isomerase
MVDTIAGAADLFASTLRDGQKILLFGNGESAADAQHIASFGDPTRSRD